MSAAHGGQLVLSHTAALSVAGAPPAGAELVDRGELRLKDLREPERIHESRWVLDSLASLEGQLSARLGSAGFAAAAGEGGQMSGDAALEAGRRALAPIAGVDPNSDLPG